MYVNTWWENEEAFNGWLKSDAFKEAHSQRNTSSQDEPSPILGNKIVKATVLTKLH